MGDEISSRNLVFVTLGGNMPYGIYLVGLLLGWYKSQLRYY
jgi:hypothetical protein